MAKVELKQPIIDEIKGFLDGAVAATVVDYRGLTVAEDTALRKALRETDFAQLDPVLDGPTALAVSKDDATAAARIFAKFAKTSPKLEFKGAVVEGKFYDAKAVQALAEIPSREELLGRLLGSIKSPVTNFARVLKQIAEKGDGEAA